MGCEDIKQLPIRDVKKVLSQALLKCAANHPSLLILDDLDSLIQRHNKVVHGERAASVLLYHQRDYLLTLFKERTYANMRTRKLCGLFLTEISKAMLSWNVLVLATCSRKDYVCDDVDRMLCPDIIELPEIQVKQRVEVCRVSECPLVTKTSPYFLVV